MFCLVSFDNEVVKERHVVPSMWLNKTNTLCLLPPVTSPEEIESLAQLSAQPADGWRMYDVSTLQTFETYAQAKEGLQKIKRVSESESVSTQKRKRRRSSYLDKNYVTSLDDDEEYDSDESRLLAEVPNSASSTAEEISTIANNIDPLIVKVEPLTDHCSPVVMLEDVLAPRDKTVSRERAGNNPPLRLDFLCDDSAIEARCVCNSACHKLILQSLRAIQKEVNKNSQLLHLLLGQQARPPDFTHNLPTDLPVTLPAADIKDVEKLELYLQDDSHFAQSIAYFTAVGGNDAKQTLKRIMEQLIGADLAPHLNWKGRGSKKPFSAYSRIHLLVFNAVKQNPKSEAITLQDVEKHIKDWLRFAPDRQGIRQRRRPELEEEKILRC